MKRNFLKTVLAIAVTATFFSCGDELLEKSPTSFINVDDAGESGQLNPAILDANLNGIYSMMINTGTGGTTSHEDFGQKGYDIMSDFLSGDLALTANNYNRYGDFANLLSTIDYANTDNYTPWRYYYRVIRSANLVINSLGGNDIVPESDNAKYSLGQAKALRAYAYFYLSQYYQAEYNGSEAILPLYKDANDPVLGQAPMSEVYDFMIEDLTSAVSFLNGFNRTSKSSVNQDVAKALLAYVYAAKGDSASNLLAKGLADQVIASGYPLMTSSEVTGGFNNAATPGWIWGFDITLTNGLDLISWWGQMDVFTYSYQWAGDKKGMDNGLYASINANDVRKTQFDTSNSLQPRNKFYNAARVIGGQRNIEDDYIYMRVAEMYLLSAEMAAKENQPAAARTRLKQLLSQRFSSAADYAYVDGLSGDALLDEVVLQTRIELWGEGKSYLSMKRNKQMMTRGSNHVFLAGLSIPHTDERLTYEIPRAEVQNNPFID
ncbi:MULTISPECIES: RagB/SusD family nutrient uptake outer membrane protein [Tenacibaculum]|uniref:RagB/SusD family nutrient uptake outer membrane protein n=1 Tax=Tenacibaculum TaxID=104267 RepID=UPI001F0B626B|nr:MULTISPECIES: RagB/SusD family nutrient uptake outer membrane protein [Tenacibaculum]MCH3880845.1 RagB/SusD family nutrient uptake outer membrane protein [Tenacibaculum aquimarinum]MDO6599556.1 RagB/SusD family nutrient uptake outer membrane protein [Tenacibaculum sp. 1_MG-2023]